MRRVFPKRVHSVVECSLKEECRLNNFNVYNHRFLRMKKKKARIKGDHCGLYCVV